VGSRTPGQRGRVAALWIQVRPGSEDYLGLGRRYAPGIKALSRDNDDTTRNDLGRGVSPAQCCYQCSRCLLQAPGRGSCYPPTGKASPIPAKETSPALGPDHTLTLNTVNNLGLLYKDQGKLKEAEEMLLRALIAYEKALGPDHISTLNTVNNLGLLYTTGDQSGTREFHSGQCLINHH